MLANYADCLEQMFKKGYFMQNNSKVMKQLLEEILISTCSEILD